MDIWYPCFNKIWDLCTPSIHDMFWPSSVDIRSFPNWWIWFQMYLPYLLQAKFQQKNDSNNGSFFFNRENVAIHEILMLPLCWSQTKTYIKHALPRDHHQGGMQKYQPNFVVLRHCIRGILEM